MTKSEGQLGWKSLLLQNMGYGRLEDILKMSLKYTPVQLTQRKLLQESF